MVKELAENEEKILSPFAQAGQQLPYQVPHLAGATGPYIHSPAGERPGLIYCAVSGDRKHFWLTATALDQAVGGTVIFVPAFEQVGPWVVEWQLDGQLNPQENECWGGLMATISRRDAGKVLIAGAGGLLLQSPGLLAAEKINSVVRSVPLGSQSYSFRDRELDACIEGFRAVGLGECEL